MFLLAEVSVGVHHRNTGIGDMLRWQATEAWRFIPFGVDGTEPDVDNARPWTRPRPDAA